MSTTQPVMSLCGCQLEGTTALTIATSHSHTTWISVTRISTARCMMGQGRCVLPMKSKAPSLGYKRMGWAQLDVKSPYRRSLRRSGDVKLHQAIVGCHIVGNSAIACLDKKTTFEKYIQRIPQLCIEL